jgi:predicted lipoprotein with Yx(FWY)xxD motif
MIRTLALATVVLLAAPVLAQTADSPLTLQRNAEEGSYLADGNGMALYLFKADQRGDAARAPVSACSDECLGAWPPLFTDGEVFAVAGIDADLLGTFERPDGIRQVTYNGWPLYYFAGDAKPGDITGHDLVDFGEDWYLIGPDGGRARD